VMRSDQMVWLDAGELPEDVMRLVFLELRDAREVASARRVCRRWRILIDSELPLWRSLTFRLPELRSTFSMAEKWYAESIPA